MKPLLNTEQLAEYLQVTTQTVYNFKKQGMPSIKIGASNRYDVEDVLRWMKEQQEKKSK